jgi:hypothetical protein
LKIINVNKKKKGKKAVKVFATRDAFVLSRAVREIKIGEIRSEAEKSSEGMLESLSTNGRLALSCCQFHQPH